MELNFLKSSKNEAEFEIDNLTLAEILKVYLNKDSSVSMAAWRREHPTKLPTMIIKTNGKTAKKAIIDAVTSVTKDLDKLSADFKKAL